MKLREVFGSLLLVFGFLFALTGIPLGILTTEYIYLKIGFVQPVCETGFSCAYSALYDCSKYILTLISVVVGALIAGLGVKQFQK